MTEREGKLKSLDTSVMVKDFTQILGERVIKKIVDNNSFILLTNKEILEKIIGEYPLARLLDADDLNRLQEELITRDNVPGNTFGLIHIYPDCVVRKQYHGSDNYDRFDSTSPWVAKFTYYCEHHGVQSGIFVEQESKS